MTTLSAMAIRDQQYKDYQSHRWENRYDFGVPSSS